MHPIRETNFVDYFKEKYPFNRELGIDTSVSGANKYIDEFVDFIKEYHMDTIFAQLKKPIEVNPLKELKNLQALDDFYNDEPQDTDRDSVDRDSDDNSEEDNGFVIPQQLFFEFEQVRKDELYQNLTSSGPGKTEYSDAEIEDKIKYTFIHDKVIFDTLNTAINTYEKRRETLRPWIKQKQAAYDRSYTAQDIISILSKSKAKVNEWLDIAAGTRKIPPPSPFDNFNNNDGMNDTMAPNQMSDEERLQQLREEKLSLLLSREIQEEDGKWNEFEASEIQIKLDLADMVLETLV